jgi:hypothetical protein
MAGVSSTQRSSGVVKNHNGPLYGKSYESTKNLWVEWVFSNCSVDTTRGQEERKERHVKELESELGSVHERIP